MALVYSLNFDGVSYSVVGNSCTAGNVIIPDTYNGLPVTIIGNSAFSSCSDIISVTIPSSITFIGESAFSDCPNLQTVSFIPPDSSLEIGGYAFQYCTSLNNVNLPTNTSLDYGFHFRGCSSLTNINLPNNLQTIPDYCLAECAISNIILPNSLTSIGRYAFVLCPLIEINLPNSIYYIGDGAFDSTSITEITLPESLGLNSEFPFISLNYDLFYDCINLKKITVGPNIQNVRSNCFDGCPNLVKVYFKGNRPGIIYGSPNFSVSNLNLKFYRKKNFVTGWGSTYGGRPVVLWSDNVIKSGGTGKLTTKKRN